MSVSQTVPSPFAALLRRSKFASFDPTIGQVYTTYGGYAFRGEWGFKRPLPNRRRSGFITVQLVDSPEQQSEWRSGESSARWMKRWEEIGKKLEVDEMSSWQARVGVGTWGFDTEFDRARKEAQCQYETQKDSEKLEEDDSQSDVPARVPNREGKNQKHRKEDMSAHNSIPNPEAMSPKQFEKYLDHLRKLRPEFKLYLLDRRKQLEKRDRRRQLPSEKSQQLVSTGTGDIHMLHSAQKAPEKFVTDFLKAQAKQEIMSPTSTRIEQRPHRLAGLEYTRMSLLQSKYLHKPSPGRNIGSNRAQSFNHAIAKPKYHLIAVGGLVGSLPPGSHNILPTDFGTRETPRVDRERGKGFFGISRVVLDQAPETVGRKPHSATHTKFGTVNFVVSKTSNLSNPHPLGSPQYVSQVADLSPRRDTRDHLPEVTTILTRKRLSQYPYISKKQSNGRELISRLHNMVTEGARRDDKML